MKPPVSENSGSASHLLNVSYGNCKKLFFRGQQKQDEKSNDF